MYFLFPSLFLRHISPPPLCCPICIPIRMDLSSVSPSMGLLPELHVLSFPLPFPPLICYYVLGFISERPSLPAQMGAHSCSSGHLSARILITCSAVYALPSSPLKNPSMYAIRSLMSSAPLTSRSVFNQSCQSSKSFSDIISHYFTSFLLSTPSRTPLGTVRQIPLLFPRSLPPVF